MKNFFRQLFGNARAIFSPASLPWHTAAILLTVVSVLSGFDWWWFELSRNATLLSLLLPAALIGFFMPFAVPMALVLIGIYKNDPQYRAKALAVAQAVIIAFLLSALYKALTGRVHPEVTQLSDLVDISRQFQFGFLRGGIFWGWPSSHTTVAFAEAFALYHLFGNKRARIVFIIYAFYIGLCVSMTIHWFSDFAAGAIFGTLVGTIVGRSFLKRRLQPMQ
ncbi:phosphatase PAP2 family protein [Candidatus Kaiserbacteria bacterium]|nr:phosphatase PAP2 family protein [Candidatus Kaiserbacteria bacterium]